MSGQILQPDIMALNFSELASHTHTNTHTQKQTHTHTYTHHTQLETTNMACQWLVNVISVVGQWVWPHHKGGLPKEHPAKLHGNTLIKQCDSTQLGPNLHSVGAYQEPHIKVVGAYQGPHIKVVGAYKGPHLHVVGAYQGPHLTVVGAYQGPGAVWLCGGIDQGPTAPDRPHVCVCVCETPSFI